LVQLLQAQAGVLQDRDLDSRKPAPCVELSWGDLLDRIAILEVKAMHSASSDASAALARELQRLESAVVDIEASSVIVDAKRTTLRTINEKLWNHKAAMRLCESRNHFDGGFLQIAREVQALEDERVRIRKEIDDAMG
jgi:predicted  nucleic acid-binding Zn-ribbon protein